MASLADTRHDSFRHEAHPNLSESSSDEEAESSDEEVLLACVYENLSFLSLLRSAVNVKARAKEKGSALVNPRACTAEKTVNVALELSCVRIRCGSTYIVKCN